MSLQGFYTTKGLALAAKIAAGAKLTVTRVTAGSGQTAAGAAVLAQEKQTLAVGTAQAGRQSATLPVTLAEVNAAASYTRTELGVYAEDPDAGEILYQVFRLEEACPIAASGESVYRFYLKQTVGTAGITVSCSPAGLLLEEDFAPVQAMVNAVSAPLTHVTLEASELAAWLNALPRLVTKNYVLHVKAGTVAQTLNLSNFYGPGRIRILADDSSGTVTLSGGVSAYFTKLQITLEGFTITGTAESEATVFGYATDCLCLYNCTLVGNGVKYGIYNQACAQIWLNGGSISGYQVAVDAIGLARIGLESVACSDNTRGATVWGCGEVMLSGSTPNTLGGSANSKSGGIITAANGTLL